MLKNYYRTAIRNLLKYKVFSFVNLFGLAIGLACCLLIATYVLHELSYDSYNKHADELYRVTRKFYNSNGGLSLYLGTVAPPFGPLLQQEFPDIEQTTRLAPDGVAALRYKEKIFSETNCFWAEGNLFDLFTIQMVRGNPHTALADPYCVVLSEPVAKKYFGEEDPLQKTLRYNNKYDFKVTGVYKPLPENAHVHPAILLSFATLRDSSVYGENNLRTDFGNNSFFTFLKLPNNYPVNRLVRQFPAFIDKYLQNAYQGSGVQPSKGTSLALQKLTDIHLYSHTDYEAEENGDINRVYIFSIIALAILVIACINYMNLATARSIARAREIGIRKVVGASRTPLVSQFLIESLAVTWMAAILGILLAFLALPWINAFAGLHLSLTVLLNWKILALIALTPFVVGIAAGFYPAIFMSSFQPMKTIKGLFKTSNTNVSLRKVLVVVQFSVSIVLIIVTIIVFQQLNYMENADLGISKDQIVTIPWGSATGEDYQILRSEFAKNPGVKLSCLSSRIPSVRLLDDMGAATYEGDSARPVNTEIKFVAVDYDFIPTYQAKLAAGRNFSRSYGTDTLGFILNESAVHSIGWASPREALGKSFRYGSTKGSIIGVLADFHFESMHQRITPLVFIMPSPAQSFFNNLSVKISGHNMPQTLAYIEQTWKHVFPQLPYRFTFLDQRFANLYQSEQRQGTLFTIFSSIAVFIGSLGLFGLSAFTIGQRVKEIGVRKVLGADISSIVALLSKDFMLLVLIAGLIAFPIAWLIMRKWLNNFAYQIDIRWWVFLLAGILAAIIALATVSTQAIKAAIVNPVLSLRNE